MIWEDKLQEYIRIMSDNAMIDSQRLLRKWLKEVLKFEKTFIFI